MPDMDEKLEQLDRERRRKYEAREEQWRDYLNNFAEETHREIAKIVGEAVASVVRDIDTADRIARTIKAGFACLRVIDAAVAPERDSAMAKMNPRAQILQAARIAALQNACGVTPRPEHPLTPDEQEIMDWSRAELQAAYAEFRDPAEAESTTLAKLDRMLPYANPKPKRSDEAEPA